MQLPAPGLSGAANRLRQPELSTPANCNCLDGCGCTASSSLKRVVENAVRSGPVQFKNSGRRAVLFTSEVDGAKYEIFAQPIGQARYVMRKIRALPASTQGEALIGIGGTATIYWSGPYFTWEDAIAMAGNFTGNTLYLLERTEPNSGPGFVPYYVGIGNLVTRLQSHRREARGGVGGAPSVRIWIGRLTGNLNITVAETALIRTLIRQRYQMLRNQNWQAQPQVVAPGVRVEINSRASVPPYPPGRVPSYFDGGPIIIEGRPGGPLYEVSPVEQFIYG